LNKICKDTSTRIVLKMSGLFSRKILCLYKIQVIIKYHRKNDAVSHLIIVYLRSQI